MWSWQLYALRVLRAQGIPRESLCDVARATVISRLTYCSPAWSGFFTAADRARLNAVLRRCRRLGYLDDTDACKPVTSLIITKHYKRTDYYTS